MSNMDSIWVVRLNDNFSGVVNGGVFREYHDAKSYAITKTRDFPWKSAIIEEWYFEFPGDPISEETIKGTSWEAGEGVSEG